MPWVDDQHVGCALGSVEHHGWCKRDQRNTCTWCGHRECQPPTVEAWRPEMHTVLQMVASERVAQVARYGHNDDLVDGTGPDSHWIPLLTEGHRALDIEVLLRHDYESYEQRTGKPSWMHLVREEVAEAFTENDPTRLEAELIQVAALCVSWVETLRRRS